MSADASQGLPIAAVEQATGIARATLRIWERRYGFPAPGRDDRGERSYPGDQVERLRAIAALIARGHRPGRLIALSPAQLGALGGPPAEGAGRAGAARTPVAADDPVLRALRGHDMAGVVRHLEESIRSSGLHGFITRRLPDLNALVGTCWARGDLQVYEEHLYTEAVQQLLRNALAAQRTTPDARPRVLLATLPEEGHGLGLLMAQVMFGLEGCACTSLGLRVPVPQVVAAAAATDADIVGLSFSACMKPTSVLRALEQLRGELPPRVAIWAGGSSPALARARIAGVQAIRHVGDIGPVLQPWRAAALAD